MHNTNIINVGLTTVQLEQLCSFEQLENTLHLLFYLNHWAKDRERLFFADRQGLYLVKSALVKHAYSIGALEVVAYVDGTQRFGNDLMLNAASDIAAEAITEHLAVLADPAYFIPGTLTKFDQMVCRFSTTMTGNTIASVDDVEALEEVQVREYIYHRLLELVHESYRTREPVPCRELEALCIAPSDMLCIQDARFVHLSNWDSWSALDVSDLRKLDPEGLSLVAFRYTGAAVRYVFHLPFRLAEAFLPEQRVRELKNMPTSSREAGEYYGRTITEAESLCYPITEILQKLGVVVAAVCPYQLGSKQEYVLAKTLAYAWRDEDEYDENEFDEEEWEETSPSGPGTRKQRSRQQKAHEMPGACPICALAFPLVSSARLEHWQQAHPWQDLTFKPAYWILGETTNKKQFCREYPPDYRLLLGRQKHGTRYWKLTTLEGWVVCANGENT